MIERAVLFRSAKELARHLILMLGADRFFERLRSKSAVRSNVLEASTRRERFSAIYEKGLWQHNHGDIPGSGEGSSLAATVELRSDLSNMLNQLKLETLVDLGCGDFTWMRMLNLSQKYIGVDVVPSVIEANANQFSDAKRAFVCLDVAEDELPDGDAILCREVLFHLSFSDIGAVLRNCEKIKSRRYFFATTDSSTLINADIKSGDFRRLNLRRPPFSFPAPDYEILDDVVEKGRIIGVWEWERLPNFQREMKWMPKAR